MADPLTLNVGMSIPTRGSDVGVWDVPVNGDFVALDGFQGGVQTIALSNLPVTLTVPAGFTATPSAGPTQAQNAVLRLTGVQTGNVTITLPMPGYYIVENLCTGNVGWVVVLQAATATQVIAIDRGMCQHVYNDGSNVRFVNLGATGQMEFWAGYSSIPAWVSNCTIPPYVLCDGGTYTYATYPALGNRLGATFGGNGVTTFGVPDLRGRVPLAYDGTGVRITPGISGINGQSMGSAADNQGITLNANQIPTITSAGTNTININNNGQVGIAATSSPGNISATNAATQPGAVVPFSTAGNWSGSISLNTANNIFVQSNNTGGQSHSNVQPSQVAGIWVIRAA